MGWSEEGVSSSSLASEYRRRFSWSTKDPESERYRWPGQFESIVARPMRRVVLILSHMDIERRSGGGGISYVRYSLSRCLRVSTVVALVVCTSRSGATISRYNIEGSGTGIDVTCRIAKETNIEMQGKLSE